MAADSLKFPRLPVPSLEHTVLLFLRSVVPLLRTPTESSSDEALRALLLRAMRFAETDAVLGTLSLQSRLINKQLSDPLWFASDWNRLAYTTYRLPLPINVSYFYALSDVIFRRTDAAGKASGASLQAGRAAALTASLDAFATLVRSGSIPSEGPSKLDTYMYRYIAHACRMPRPEDDGVRVHDGDGMCAPQHCVVAIRKGLLYRVDLSAECDHSHSKRVSLDQLTSRFAAVIAHADKHALSDHESHGGSGKEPALALGPDCSEGETGLGGAAAAVAHAASGVGTLTAAHRDNWATVFPRIFGRLANKRPSHGFLVAADDSAELPDESLAVAVGKGEMQLWQLQNYQTLRTIEACLAIVCLDDSPALPSHTDSTTIDSNVGSSNNSSGSGSCSSGGGAPSSTSHKRKHGAACEAQPTVTVSAHGRSASRHVAAFSHNLMIGNCHNRWFDKALQLVVDGDGSAGLICEHSHCDGMPTAAAVAWMARCMSDAHSPVFATTHTAATAAAATGTSHSGSSSNSSTGAGAIAEEPTSSLLPSLDVRHDATCVQPLPIVLDCIARRSLAAARVEVASSASRHVLRLVRWDAYGSDGIKRQGVSPDAWAQMAMQLAHLMAFGVQVPTYEPAHTRRFAFGRTACIRVLSEEARVWACAMRDALSAACSRPSGGDDMGAAAITPSSCSSSTNTTIRRDTSSNSRSGSSSNTTSNCRDASNSSTVGSSSNRSPVEPSQWSAARLPLSLSLEEAVRLHSLLKDAGRAHACYARKASAGQDADRHLLALKLQWRARSDSTADSASREGREVFSGATGSPVIADACAAADAFFSDPWLARSSEWRLSTSNLTVPAVCNWGFGQVTTGGLGVAYSVHANHLVFNVVSEAGTNSFAFAECLLRALQAMWDCASAAQAAALDTASAHAGRSMLRAKL